MSDIKDVTPQNTSEDSLHEKTSNDNVITNEEQKGDNLDKDGGKSTDMGDNSDTETYMSPDTLEKLTIGFLSHCLPDLQKAKGALSEILTNQNVLQETVQNENTKFNMNEDIEKTMTKAKLYHSKLLYLKREMSNLSEKSFKMKKRGIKLQQQKIKEELHKQEQEEKDKMREEMLTAKVAKKRSSSQSDKS